MPQAAVAADFLQALDVHVDLTPQVAFHLVVSLDDIAQPRDLSLVQVLDPQVRADARHLQNLLA